MKHRVTNRYVAQRRLKRLRICEDATSGVWRVEIALAQGGWGYYTTIYERDADAFRREKEIEGFTVVAAKGN
jgi:hypothetical protein